METAKCDVKTEKNEVGKEDKSFIEVSSNCEVVHGKKIKDAITTVLISKPELTIKLDEVVSLDTCILLRSKSAGDTFKLDLRLTNGQKIAQIAIVSEASVLEFFKQAGEYASTVFADFIDEFDDHATYIGETSFDPPSAEASINFVRRKKRDSKMWLYAIRLVLTEVAAKPKMNMFNMDVIDNYLLNANGKSERLDMAKKLLQTFDSDQKYDTLEELGSCLNKFKDLNLNSRLPRATKEVRQSNDNQSKSKDASPNCNGSQKREDDLQTYIDNKLINLEKRLIKRIEIMEDKTQQKLDAILKQLQAKV